MKKILYFLSAIALVLLAGSCIKEQLTTFDADEVVAPHLGMQIMGKKSVTIKYTPAVFNRDFNTKMDTHYSVVMVAVNGKPVEKNISASIDNNTITIPYNTLSKAFMDLGYAEGTKVESYRLVLRASIQPSTYDSSVLSYVDSNCADLFYFDVTAPQGSPYPEYTDDSPWSVTGALSAYGINWDKDLQMWATSDGTKHVAKAVTLKAGDEFKFRKDQGWAENYGGDFGGLDADFGVTGGGPNIIVGADGVYDLWLDTASQTAGVTEAYLPYPGMNEVSAWGVTGALASYGINWDKDIAMYTDGTTHVAMNVKIGASDEFKFRKDGGWAENYGGDFGGLDADFAVTGGGPNIIVGAEGVYDLILDTEAQTARVAESLGGGFSGIIGAGGGDEPEPEPEDDIIDEAWALIGGINGTSWNKDFYMTKDDEGLWTSPIVTFEADGEFKLRFDNTWDYEDCIVGAADADFYATVGEAFTGAQPGNNIKIKDAGDYYVTFKESTLEVTVYSMANQYTLIGTVNGTAWDTDFYMTEGEGGVWTSDEVTIKDEFKIRFNKSWADENCYGIAADTETPMNTEFTATQPGANFKVPEEGKYTVKFVPATKTVTIIPSKPANKWSVIGDFNGWGDDAYMTEVFPGIWVSEPVALTAGGWKIRFNNDWTVNRGGATGEELSEAGVFAGAYQNGENFKLAGTYKVIYNANNETVGTLGWGIVGSVASIEGFNWNNDIPMNLAADGKWYSLPVTLDEGDEIKLRWLADWGTNRGGAIADADTAFDVTQDGDNFKGFKAGTYVLVYDPTAEKVTVSTDFWSLIGAFSEWGTDKFMLALGGGKWAAYNQSVSGEWKFRKGADWGVNFGGTFAAAGDAIAVTQDGPNISVSGLDGNFDIVLDTAAATATVSAAAK